MKQDEARKQRAKEIATQFPVTEAGMKLLADRCAFAELALAEFLFEREKQRLQTEAEKTGKAKA